MTPAPAGSLHRILTRTVARAGSPAVRWGFGLGAVGLAGWAVAGRWDQVVAAMGRLNPTAVLAAALATVANATLAGLMWRRVLVDLGSRLPALVAARVFFVGQLGKYVPGSVWPMVVQAELASDHGVPRRRTASAGVVAILLAGASGVLVVAAAAPFSPRRLPWWAVLAVPAACAVVVALLHPAVLGAVLDRGLAVLGRQPLEQRTTVRGTLVATGWAVAAWCCAGLQLFALALPLGASATLRTLVLLTAGYVLAWTVGFVVIVAPAGAGARELALAAVLAGTLDRGAVVVVVLVSRVLFTAVDLGLAGFGLGAGRARGGAARRAVGAPGAAGGRGGDSGRGTVRRPTP